MQGATIAIIIILIIVVVVVVALLVWYFEKKAITQKACKDITCGYDKTGKINCGKCSDVQNCVEGHCVNKECQSNSDCTGGKVCLNNVCVNSCKATSDCPSGLICTNGQCVNPPTPSVCKTTSDCSNNYLCSESGCVCPTGSTVTNNICHLNIPTCSGTIRINNTDYCVNVTYLSPTSATLTTLNGKNSVSNINLSQVTSHNPNSGNFYLITTGIDTASLNNALILYISNDGHVTPISATYNNGNYSSFNDMSETFKIDLSNFQLYPFMGTLVFEVLSKFYN